VLLAQQEAQVQQDLLEKLEGLGTPDKWERQVVLVKQVLKVIQAPLGPREAQVSLGLLGLPETLE
jgi:biotin synthase-related radical SAM superfamily protein